MDITDEQFKRLPRYAQDHIRSLQLKLVRAEARAAEARLATKPEESDVLLSPYDAVPVGLGRGTEVRFLLRDARGQHNREHWVDVRVRSHGALEVMGGRGLAIIPRSSNLAYIRIED